jgi:hypothetical protein
VSNQKPEYRNQKGDCFVAKNAPRNDKGAVPRNDKPRRHCEDCEPKAKQDEAITKGRSLQLEAYTSVSEYQWECISGSEYQEQGWL